ncbi:ATP-binding protein [Komagataeibacter rhaeticus]|nr:ATP-binding protein [Komagataeibacter rhaeticus]
MHDVRLVRPLLSFAKPALYATVRAAGLAWVEDPSNADLRTGRARARQALAQDAGRDAALKAQALQAGQARMERDRADACWLASHARFHPGGWVVLPAGLAPPRILSALIRVVGGHDYPPTARVSIYWHRPHNPRRWQALPSCHGGTGSGLSRVRKRPWRHGCPRGRNAYGTGVSCCVRAACRRIAPWGGRCRGIMVACRARPAGLARARAAHASRAVARGRVVAVPHMGVCTQGGMADAVL